MRFALAAFAIVFLAASGAEAANEKKRARAALAEAKAAFAKKDYANAGAKYLEAHEILVAGGLPAPPALLYNGGLSYSLLGACEKAVGPFEAFAAQAKKKISPKVAEQIAEARRCAPEVAIDSTPASAEVRIDGEVRGVTPLSVPLRAGEHRVVLRLAGYLEISETIRVEAGRPRALAKTLVSVARTGRVTVRVADGSRVFLDDAPVGVGPLEEVRDLDAGAHTVRLERDGCVERRRVVEVTAGDRHEVAFSAECAALPAPPPPAPPAAAVETRVGGDDTVAWIVGGAGASALVVGGVLFALSASARADIDAELEKPDGMRDATLIGELNDDIKRNNAIGGVAVALGAVGVGVAVVLFLSGDEEAVALDASGASGMLVRF